MPAVNTPPPLARYSPENLPRSTKLEVFPHGFLTDVYVLKALDDHSFNEISGENDFHDVCEGEVLLTAELQEQVTGGEICSKRVFLGLEGLSGTSYGYISKVDGADLLTQLKSAAEVFGGDAQKILALLSTLLEQSNILEGLHREGAEILRPDLESGDLKVVSYAQA